jgi:hypothetical protein
MSTDKYAHHRRVWWAFLPERCIYDLSWKASMQIAYRLGQLSQIYPEQKWEPVWTQYGRTDITRQGLSEVFQQESSRPDDTLIMLDIDHDHPVAVAKRLAAHDLPVVVPLMFRRGEPYDACAFRRGPDNELHHLRSFDPGVFEMNWVGSGAIAIQRWVFDKLAAAGHKWFFKYEYFDDPQRAPSEDLYFSKICEAAGIKMYVDTTFETRHISLGTIGQDTHEAYVADHPEEYAHPLTIRSEQHGDPSETQKAVQQNEQGGKQYDFARNGGST